MRTLIRHPLRWRRQRRAPPAEARLPVRTEAAVDQAALSPAPRHQPRPTARRRAKPARGSDQRDQQQTESQRCDRRQGVVARIECGRVRAGSMNEHDSEEQQHEHAAGVHEDLGESQEPESEQREETCDAEQERPQPECHAHHITAEGDGSRADKSDRRKPPEERGHRDTSVAASTPSFVGERLTPGPVGIHHDARASRGHPGALSAPVARDPSPERTISSRSNIVRSRV